jgi:hypothetical protein
LFTKALRYSAAFLSMIAEHRTLDGSMADIAATAQDFYWGVDGNEDVKAVKIDLTAVYEM